MVLSFFHKRMIKNGAKALAAALLLALSIEGLGPASHAQAAIALPEGIEDAQSPEPGSAWYPVDRFTGPGAVLMDAHGDEVEETAGAEASAGTGTGAQTQAGTPAGEGTSADGGASAQSSDASQSASAQTAETTAGSSSDTSLAKDTEHYGPGYQMNTASEQETRPEEYGPGVALDAAGEGQGTDAASEGGSEASGSGAGTGSGAASGTGSEMPAEGTASGTGETAIDGTAEAQGEGAAAGEQASEETAPLIDPNLPMVALTFDDGPNAGPTGRILDSLEKNGARATFFVVGDRVSANAASILRAHQLGCEIGNHTYGHKYITKLSAEGLASQLDKTNQLVAGVTGVSPVLMRPPGGFYDSASLSVVGGRGMSAIMWSIDTRDWQHRNAQKTIDEVLSKVKDGDIILMHDLYSATADAAEVLIPELKARGYQLVTVSELASYRGGAAPGKIYSRFRPTS